MAKQKATAVRSNAARAAAYGMEGVRVDDNDPIAVFEAAGAAVRRAREGGGPTLLEVKTDRWFGHFQGDPEVYRPKTEVPQLRKSDPIQALRGLLRRRGILDDAKDAALQEAAAARVAAAIEFARASESPAPAEALQHVFA